MTKPDASTYVLDFSDITLDDVARAGGKNASLGELFGALKPAGVGVVDGFATTAAAYWRLLATNELEKTLRAIFSPFDIENLEELSRRGDAARRAVAETRATAEV
jgi:pyruvate, water dikinase